MVSSIGYALGAGSGIDTAKLIEDLYNASRAPKEAAIKKREEANAARISALGEASNAIASFSSALASLVAGGSLFTQPTVSDSSILSASALPGSRLSSLTGKIEVKQLAQSQMLASVAVGSASAPVGEGALTLTIGGRSETITIGSANNNLTGLARAINDKKMGITATILAGAYGAKLVLKGPTGAANTFSVTAPDGTSSGLERFTFADGVGSMTQTQTAADAILVIDDIEVTRNSNSISDLIAGVQIDLKKAVPGTTVELGSQRPTAAIKQSVSDFVAAYNELHSLLTEMLTHGSQGLASGPLRGDVGLRDAQRRLAALPRTALATDGAIQTLADIGVATNRDGSLTVNEQWLDKALENDPDGVESLFNPTQHSSSPFLSIASKMGAVKPGTYTFKDVVPSDGTSNATAVVDGVTVTGIGRFIVPPSTSTSAGLSVEVAGAVAEATLTIDPGLAGTVKAIRDALFALNGPLTMSNERLRDDAEDIADDRAAMDARTTAYRDRLVSTYAAMEKRVSAFKATQSYLEQQIKAWNRSDD